MSDYICPHCQKSFPEWYWGVSGRAGGYGTIMKPGLAKANFARHKKACSIAKWTPTTFAAIPIGGEFIEALTTCNEVATRIEPTTHQGKPVNARRSGGKLILMVECVSVFVEESI